MIHVAGMEIADVIRRISIRRIPDFPLDVRDVARADTEQLNSRGTEKRHRKVTAQIHALLVVANHHRQRAHQVLALVAVLPEFGPAIGFDQESRYHDMTVDEHTFAVVQAAIMVTASAIFLMNILIDLLYVALDPRIRHQ